MTKEVNYSFTMGATLSPSFKAALSGAERQVTGLAARMKDLQDSDVGTLGGSFVRQKEHIRSLAIELGEAKKKLELLRSQSKGAEKDTKIFSLQLKQAENDVKNLSAALEKNVYGYQKNIAKIRNTQGSVRSLAAEYAKLSQEIEKTNSVQSRLKALQEKREALQTRRGAVQGEMVQTAIPALALSVPIKQAVDFEAAMADVAKTMDGMRDDDGNLTAKYYAMEEAVKKMARQIPLSHEEIAGLFAAAGQQGLTELSEIENFVAMSAQMAVAFGMSQEQAADAIGGYRSALGLSFDETRSMLDLMNQFANTSSATEQDIANVMRRIGSLGGQAGMTVKPMTALSATLVSMKIPPEEAATGIKNFLLALTSGKAATKSQTQALNELGFGTEQLAKAMQNDAPKAVLAVLNSIKKLSKHEQLSTMQTLFGKESLAVIAPLLGQLDLVTKNLEICADETQYAGAMQKEFSARIRTTQANAQLFSSKVKEVSINLGSALLPAVNSTLDTLSPLIENFAEFAQENPVLIKYLIGTAGALLGFKIASLTASYAVTGLRSAWLTAKGVVLVLSAATKTQTYSLAAQKAVVMASAAGTKVFAAAQRTTAGAAALLTAAQNRNIASLAVQKTAMLASAGATKATAAAQWILNAAMSANPIGLVVKGLGMACAAMYALYQTCEPVRNAFDWAFGGIAGFVQNIWEKLQKLWEGAKSIGQALGLIDEDIELELTENVTRKEPAGSAADMVQNGPTAFSAQAMENSLLALSETVAVRKTAEKEPLTSAAGAVSEPMSVSAADMIQNGPTAFSAQALAKPVQALPATAAVQNLKTFESNTQNISGIQNTQISVPMNFTVTGLDEKTFRRHLEKAKPDIAEFIKKIVEAISHEKARVDFAD